MSEDISVERAMTRGEAADFLREFAEELDPGGSITRGSTAGGRTETGAAGGPTESDVTSDTAEGEPTSAPAGSDTRSGPAETATTGEPDGADHPGRITLAVGNEATVLLPPERIRFRVETDSGSGLLETGTEQSVDFRISWDVEEVPESDVFEVK